MSLFNETVRRLSEAEAALALSEQRCRDLEKLLKREQAKNRRNTLSASVARSADNALSEEETERMFAKVQPPKPDFQVHVRVVPWWERLMWWRG